MTEWKDNRGKIMSLSDVLMEVGDMTEWKDNRGKIMSLSDVLMEVGT